MPTESTIATIVRVDASHQNRDRLTTSPSITARRAPVQQRNKIAHRFVSIHPYAENAHPASSTSSIGVKSLYRTARVLGLGHFEFNRDVISTIPRLLLTNHVPGTQTDTDESSSGDEQQHTVTQTRRPEAGHER